MNNSGAGQHSDVIVVGAGVIGTAHAMEAINQGYSVRVLERDAAAVGASVRNFGHACITAQGQDELDLAHSSREGWLHAARQAGFWAAEAGAVVVARRDEELAVLEQFRQARGPEQVELLEASEVVQRLHGGTEAGDVLGGAFLPLDLRVDPRVTVAALAAWIEEHERGSIEWRTSVTNVDHGTVTTNRGTFTADHVIVCVGHDVDHLYPQIADRWEIVRCALHMAMAGPVPGVELDSAVLTGTSMLRYGGFSATPAAADLKRRIEAETPELLDMVANVMFTRRPDGTLLLGDSHEYGLAMPPFLDEGVSDRLLGELAGLLGGTTFSVRQRWQGVYSSSPLTNLVVETPQSRTTVVTVTSGIGMTLAFGVARRTVAGL